MIPYNLRGINNLFKHKSEENETHSKKQNTQDIQNTENTENIQVSNELNNETNKNIQDNENTELPKDYSYIQNFKKQKLEERIKISEKLRLKHSDRIPIIVDCKKDFSINKNKFIVSQDLTVGQFMYIIKKRISLTPEQAIFLLCNNSLIMNTDTLFSVYNKHKDYDGFLYIFISRENAFGNFF